MVQVRKATEQEGIETEPLPLLFQPLNILKVGLWESYAIGVTHTAKQVG